MDFFRRIKWFFQRGIRGYADCDTWDLHNYLCRIIPPCVRSIKKYHIGCPPELYDESKNNDECHRWREILESIAQGFESAQAITNMEYYTFKKDDDDKKKDYSCRMVIDEKKLENLNKKYKEGLSLFHDYFMNLWD